MTESARLDALIKIRDGLVELIDSYKPKGIEDNIPDLSMILWKDAVGDRGPFQVAEVKSNANNAAFERLNSYLQAHSGKATVSGFFLWKFTDGSGSIGRKVVQKP